MNPKLLDAFCARALVESAINGFSRPYTTTEIAEWLGVSSWSISLIERQALRKVRFALRWHIREYGPDDPLAKTSFPK
jgi:DNA-directed RNA polymerase sigma subunit (sigma70/sigma32)